MQAAILSQNQDVFCEEYCCVTRSVAADGRGFDLQVQEICNRYRRSPVHVVPEFPHFHCWISHDALTPCGESGMTPRILQPFRPSTYTVKGTWGADDGKAGNLNAENLVSDTHCFFCVEALIPKNLTLSHLLGTMVRRLPDSFHAAGFCCPWWIPEDMIKRTHPILETNAPEADSLYYSETLEYQMLGGLFLSALRHDNVMHPHLRSHFEFHVGKLLSLEIFRNTLDVTTVIEFLVGCGVEFQAGSGWLEEKLSKRTKVGTDALTLYAHSLWGAKCRVHRYIDADADIMYMIPTACHMPKICQNHLQLCGYGCICNGYHGFTERYARQLMFHALQYLGCEGVVNKGDAESSQGAEGLGFVYALMGELGLHCPLNEQYHNNPARRLQLFHLPKWAPKFLGESAREKIPEEELATWPPCQKAYFSKAQAEAALKAKLNQTKQFAAFEKLSLAFDKKPNRKNA